MSKNSDSQAGLKACDVQNLINLIEVTKIRTAPIYPKFPTMGSQLAQAESRSVDLELNKEIDLRAYLSEETLELGGGRAVVVAGLDRGVDGAEELKVEHGGAEGFGLG